MRVAVVILNFNGEKYLRQFLPSVVQHSAQAQLVVADNGSTDHSLDVIQEFTSVRWLALPQNYGFCKGYNEALRQVDADVFVLLNSDVEVTAGWLDPILKLLKQQEHIVAVQPKILSFQERMRFEYAGAGGGLIDAFGYPFCRGRIFQQREEDNGQYNDECRIFWASGACMAIRASTYWQHGGLDEDYFAHMEEIDLCWKIHHTLQEVWFTGQSTVYHVGAGTLGYESPFKTYLNFRNNWMTVLKHWTTGELLWKAPIRFMLDLVAGLSFLLRGRGKSSLAVVHALVAVLMKLPAIMSKRRQIRRSQPDYDRTNVFSGLILFRYLSGRAWSQ